MKYLTALKGKTLLPETVSLMHGKKKSKLGCKMRRCTSKRMKMMERCLGAYRFLFSCIIDLLNSFLKAFSSLLTMFWKWKRIRQVKGHGWIIEIAKELSIFYVIHHIRKTSVLSSWASCRKTISQPTLETNLSVGSLTFKSPAIKETKLHNMSSSIT